MCSCKLQPFPKPCQGRRRGGGTSLSSVECDVFGVGCKDWYSFLAPVHHVQALSATLKSEWITRGCPIHKVTYSHLDYI